MTETFPRIEPLGDSALRVALGESIDLALNRRVQALAGRLSQAAPPGVGEVVSAYASLTVHFDLMRIDYFEVKAWVETLLDGLAEQPQHPARVVEIPVLYGGEHGPDLAFVAQHSGLTESEVVAIHSGGEYPVYMMGFTPGFAYLGGLDARIAAPRLPAPRSSVPAGSVGIAGQQTGVYSLESPGGWRLIGWTPLRLFDPSADPPTLLQAGDVVRFVAVSAQGRVSSRPG